MDNDNHLTQSLIVGLLVAIFIMLAFINEGIKDQRVTITCEANVACINDDAVTSTSTTTTNHQGDFTP